MLIFIHCKMGIGAIKKEQKGSIQDVQQLAMMVELVITQKLGMDLLLVVNQEAQGMQGGMSLLQNGVDNYFQQLKYLKEL